MPECPAPAGREGTASFAEGEDAKRLSKVTRGQNDDCGKPVFALRLHLATWAC
ncbi:MAG: hypothetical protein ABL949_06695 [Fimbriimonadaceae bacterium]